MKLSIVLAVSAVLFFTGCSNIKDPLAKYAYKVTIRQGNLLEDSWLELLRVGLSKEQVEYVLGRPVLVDIFKPNVWTYYSGVSKGRKYLYKTSLVINFDDNDQVIDFKVSETVPAPENVLDLTLPGLKKYQEENKKKLEKKLKRRQEQDAEDKVPASRQQ